MIEFLANFLIAIVIAVLCLVFIEFVGFIVEVPKQLKRIADALEKDKKDILNRLPEELIADIIDEAEDD